MSVLVLNHLETLGNQSYGSSTLPFFPLRGFYRHLCSTNRPTEKHQPRFIRVTISSFSILRSDTIVFWVYFVVMRSLARVVRHSGEIFAYSWPSLTRQVRIVSVDIKSRRTPSCSLLDLDCSPCETTALIREYRNCHIWGIVCVSCVVLSSVNVHSINRRMFCLCRFCQKFHNIRVNLVTICVKLLLNAFVYTSRKLPKRPSGKL